MHLLLHCMPLYRYLTCLGSYQSLALDVIDYSTLRLLATSNHHALNYDVTRMVLHITLFLQLCVIIIVYTWAGAHGSRDEDLQ